MCEIVSVGVEPRTFEVFWTPGIEQHTELCEKLGLNYDKIFKPDIQLATRQIKFYDGSLAIKRTLPPELLVLILKELNEVPSAQIDLNIFYAWTEEHAKAVWLWMEKYLPTAKELIKFSEHSWNPVHFKGTIKSTGKYQQVLSEIPSYELLEAKTKAILRRVWIEEFKNPVNRSLAWVTR